MKTPSQRITSFLIDNGYTNAVTHSPELVMVDGSIKIEVDSYGIHVSGDGTKLYKAIGMTDMMLCIEMVRIAAKAKNR
jgi:hypothetical protein